MKQRFIWSIGFAMVVMTFLIPFNYFLSTTFTTPAQKVQAGFYTLIIVESQLVFLTSFVIVSQYFTLHSPNMNQVIELHKEEHPDIPDTYYKDPKSKSETPVQQSQLVVNTDKVDNIIKNTDKPKGKKGVKK
jgi:hypothetical protein